MPETNNEGKQMTTPREHADDKTEQTMTDVLPCPFCGSTEGFYVVKGSTFSWRAITCRSCGEGTEVRHKNNSDEPDSYIADWNAAAPYPAMLRKELDALRAQLTEAQRDAERYRSLRRGQKWSVIDWKGDALRADDLDAAIDAAKGESNG